jgi:hypothetical protein
MPEVAAALRRVTAEMRQDLDAGRRPAALDAEDLIDVLLTLADELDPFTPRPRYSPAADA